MLEAEGISKSYGGVQALVGANLTVRAGTVHALLGENGAGKSTLVKIIVGAVERDAGSLRLDGQEVSFSSTADAARHGVAVVSQELSLFPDLDVLTNLFTMREPKLGPFADRREMAKQATPVLRDLGLDVKLHQLVGTLSLQQRQLVEIAKALVTKPSVLVLDEPTSALEAASTEALMNVLRVMRERQVAVVFVSHILQEVMALSDEVTVLRDGRVVMAAKPRSDLTVPTIVGAMLGEHDELSAESGSRTAQSRATEASTARVVADIEAVEGDNAQLSLEGASVTRALDDVTFKARAGEIVGLAGLTGSGHAAVVQLVTGQRRADHGRVLLPGGKPVPRGLRRAICAGVAFVTGDRRRYGLMLDKPIWENVMSVRSFALARDGSLIRKSTLREASREYIAQLRIRTPSVNAPAGALSGGNQQKVVFAKWLAAKPSVMVLDDPTRGVDVGAKAEMHNLIRATAEGNAVVLFSSTDLDELCGVCDRVLVFFQHKICTELSGDSLTLQNLLESMNTGVAPVAAA
jgi:ABC-type sugar transport system ATPase subunit